VPTTTPETDLKRILAGAQLPALPQSAIRLLELSQDPNNGPAEFALPIEADPGLTGQVLRFVNSSYFGFSREISSVKLAITLVGIRTIKNFALWSAVFSLMPNPQCGPFDLKKLWQDSLRRGLFARALGKLLGLKDAEEAFAAALLQDMAVPLLAKELTKDYLALLEQREGGRVRLSALEQERFGWTHAQAGAEIARMWNLPTEFANLVQQHAAIDEALSNPQVRPEVAAVTLSALLPAASDDTWVECGQFEQAYGQLKRPDNPAVVDLLARIDQEFVEFAPVLKLSTPAKSLVESYNEVAVAAG
jgi:HD-like signal output (HDOD) protein